MHKIIIERNCKIRKTLLELAENDIYLEGNILKLIECKDNDLEFKQYLKVAIERDYENRRKRLGITKRIQIQNEELESNIKIKNALTTDLEVALKKSKHNELIINQLKNELEEKLHKTNKEKEKAIEDLEVLQRKTEFRLMNLIVRTALTIIIGVGVTTTFLYAYIVASGADSKIIETTWSNLFGILLTNSFSIIGTIMGVRYVNNKLENKKEEII